MGYSIQDDVWVNDEDGQVVTDPVLGQKLTNDYNREKKVPISTLASLANSTNLLGTDTQKIAVDEMQKRLSDGYMAQPSQSNLPKNKLSTTPVEEQGWFQMGNEKPESVKDILMQIDPKLVEKTNRQAESNKDIYDQLKKVTGMEKDNSEKSLAERNKESLIESRKTKENISEANTLKGLQSLAKNDPNVKSFNLALDFKNKMDGAYKRATDPNTKDRSASDLSLGMLINKFLDEDSVVRESEFDRVTEMTPIISRLRGISGKLISGGLGVDDSTRKAIYDEAMGLFNSVKNTYDYKLKNYWEPVLSPYNKLGFGSVNIESVLGNTSKGDLGFNNTESQSSVYNMTPEQRARRKEELLAKKNKKE